MQAKDRRNDPAVQQIIDRCLKEHFSIGAKPAQPGDRTIDEIQSEWMREIAKRSTVVDFGRGESCEFRGDPRMQPPKQPSL